MLPAARHLPRRLHLLLTQGRYRPSDSGEKPASEAALPPPQPAMPRKSLEQVYGRTGCNSVPLHRARLATVIVREGTRFRLTREGWLLFLVQQSCPTAALASPCTTPASHTLGGAPARGGRCAAPGQPWKAARHLDRSGQPWIGRAPLLLTALVQRDWATRVPGWGPPWLSHHPWFHLPLMPRASAN